MKKTFVFFLSLISALIILEIGIRLSGYIFSNQQSKFNQNFDNNNSKKQIHIFTLGESTTAVAADESNNFLIQDTSYPVILEKILNKKSTEYKFKVHNLGVMGGNTETILYKLDEYLKKTKPNIIVSMMGMKDNNFTRKAYTNIFSKEVFSISNFLIENSRIAKLILLLTEERNNKIDLVIDPDNIKINKQYPFVLSQFIIEATVNYFNIEFNKNLTQEKIDKFLNIFINIAYLETTGNFERSNKLILNLIKNENIGHFILVEHFINSNQIESALNLLNYLKNSNPKNSFVFSKLIYLALIKENNGYIEKLLSQKKLLELPIEDLFYIDIELSKFFIKNNQIIKAKEILSKYKDYFLVDQKKIQIFLSLDFWLRKRSIRSWQDDGLIVFKNLSRLETINSLNILNKYLLFYFTTAEIEFLLKNYNSAMENILVFNKISKNRDNAGINLLLKIEALNKIKNEKESILKNMLSGISRVSDIYELSSNLKKYKSSELSNLESLINKTLPGTKYNFEELYKRSKNNNSTLILMQYPTFDLEIVKYFLKKEDVIYIDNKNIFSSGPKTDFLFEPRYPYKFNHYTRKGAEILANQVANKILYGLKTGEIKL